MQLGDERVVGHTDRAASGAADGDLVSDRVRRTAVSLRLEHDESADSAAAALRRLDGPLDLLVFAGQRWSGSNGRIVGPNGACLRPRLGTTHFAPHRPQNPGEEQVEQRQEDVLENAEKRLGGSCDHVASKRRCVLPTLTMSPSASVRSLSIRVPLILVPLVDPRSTITKALPRWCTSVCLRLTFASGKAMVQSGSRPIVTTRSPSATRSPDGNTNDATPL